MEIRDKNCLTLEEADSQIQAAARSPIARRSSAQVRAKALVLLAAASVIISAAGCEHHAESPFQRPSEIHDFGQLYAKNCAGCHGAEGQLGPAPPLADPLFLALVSDEQLVQVVSNGRASTLMPPFAQAQGGPLTDQQITILAQGIREKWGKDAGETAEHLPDYLAPSVMPTAVPEESPAAAKLFAQVCGGCHGTQGEGGEKAGALNDPSFLALASDQFLRRIIITGRPDLGMPDFRDLGAMSPVGRPLDNEQIIQIVDLLRAWRQRSTASRP